VAVIGGFFGVGLGFGLKNVTENFISGIILLLEQPVQMGDKVSIQEHIGTVKKIGIRSTLVETFDNITLILPNSLLVQEQVINWSHSDPKIRLHIPFGVAYGSDVELLRKVALNTAAINDPDLVRKASRRFGSSTVVVSIEAIKKDNGFYEAYTDNGRQETGVDVFDWAKKSVEFGAGEIMITSIDTEGTMKGFDTELVKKVSQIVSVPVIASGGGWQIGTY